MAVYCKILLIDMLPQTQVKNREYNVLTLPLGCNCLLLLYRVTYNLTYKYNVTLFKRKNTRLYLSIRYKNYTIYLSIR